MVEWFMLISSLILAVITGVYAWQTRKLVKINQEMVKINQEMLKLSNTPEVRVFLTPRLEVVGKTTLDLCIQNIGTGIAYNMKISGNLIGKLADWDIIKNGVSHFGPDKRYQIILYQNYEPGNMPEHIFTVHVTYEDSAKEKVSKSFPLDIRKVESYPQMGDPSFESIAESLKRIEGKLNNR